MVSKKFKPGQRVYWLSYDGVTKHYGTVIPYEEAEQHDIDATSQHLKVWALWDRAGVMDVGFVYEDETLSGGLEVKYKRNLPDWF